MTEAGLKPGELELVLLWTNGKEALNNQLTTGCLQAWKSNPHYFCEVCRVWLNDNPSARATHERGIKHQENVSRKLRDMRKKADDDKKSEALAAASMSTIEAKARRQYEQDIRESTEARADLHGTWEPDDASGHLYNARHRYYFNSSTGMYYGGDPAAWTLTPDIPPEALYKAKTDAQKAPAASTSGAQAKKLRPGMRAQAHPLSNIGGYRMPTVGAIGGAKGVGAAKDPAATASGGGSGAKRAREADAAGPTKAGKGVAASKEEREALARREAARARVQQRTMQAFGLR